jgi:hypothetical protein
MDMWRWMVPVFVQSPILLGVGNLINFCDPSRHCFRRDPPLPAKWSTFSGFDFARTQLLAVKRCQVVESPCHASWAGFVGTGPVFFGCSSSELSAPYPNYSQLFLTYRGFNHVQWNHVKPIIILTEAGSKGQLTIPEVGHIWIGYVMICACMHTICEKYMWYIVIWYI